MPETDLEKYRSARKIVIVLIILIILGFTGLHGIKKSSTYNKFLEGSFNVKSEKEEVEELRKSYIKGIEEDLYYLVVIMIKDSLDNPDSYVLLNRSIEIIEPNGRRKQNRNDRIIRFFIKYWYNDSTGRRNTAIRYMNFDRDLKFLGESKGE